jgi:tetratricopeptide (TPR) repeat protein
MHSPQAHTIATSLARDSQRVVLLEAQPGAARTALLREAMALLPASEKTLLACAFHRRGPYSGLAEALEEEIQRLDAPDVLREHDYEIAAVLPSLGRKLGVRNRPLTDVAEGDELVRNYPIDRAYRLVSGLVDFFAESRHRTQRDGGWILGCDEYDDAGAMVRRFVRELLRRKGQALGVRAILAVAPGQALRCRDELEAGGVVEVEIVRVELELEAAPTLDPDASRHRAMELERRIGDDPLLRETHLAELAAAWEQAGGIQRALRYWSLGLGVLNHAGLYEDALRYGRRVLERIDELCGEDEDLRWSTVGNLFHAYVATGNVSEGLRIVHEEGRAKLRTPALQVRVLYVLAMLEARYLPERNLDLAATYLLQAQALLRTAPMTDADRAFLEVFLANGLALVRHRQGRSHEAVALCEAGAETLTARLGTERHRLHRSVLHYNAAQVYAAIGAYDDAIREFSSASELDPAYSEYFNDRGSARLKKGDLLGARDDYERAITLSPPYAEVRTNLGQCHRLLGAHEAAVAAYSAALDLEPNDLLALEGRADAYEALGTLDLALADAHRLVALLPTSTAALGNRARLRFERGDLEGALADLDTAIALDDAVPGLRYNRAFALAAAGRADAAARDLRTYLALAPDAADRAEVLAELSRLAAA